MHRHRAGFAKGPGFGPWGFGGPPWRFPGPGSRAGRGDVRSAILFLLAERPMHGYQVIQELTERSGGMWQPSPGSRTDSVQGTPFPPREGGRGVRSLARFHRLGRSARFCAPGSSRPASISFTRR